MSDKNYKSTSINEYFAWLEKNIPTNTALYEAAHLYMQKERDDFANAQTGDTPFLSIITRTQGKRPDMLTEMLLCLTGQSNTDFELLVMGHNLTDDQHAQVSSLIEELPDWMRAKTRLVPVNGGTRTTPLNRGFEEARGKYIAVLDDDDLVFDHWVEAFYELSKKRDGTILHTYSVLQDWETVGGRFSNTPRAAGAPDNVYCRKFKLYDQLKLNTCPLCTLAFPAYAFKTFGIRFDEELTTTEDWDYLMRCSFLTGVSNSDAITFLYRNWLNAENSASIHKKDEWDKNYQKIVQRFMETPILMPPKSLKSAIEAEDEEEDSLFMQELFYNDGNGFDQAKKFQPDFNFSNKQFNFCFIPAKEELCEITSIRFDPHQYGYLTVSDLLVRVVCEDDSMLDFEMNDVKTNGRIINGKLVFLKNDPQIHFSLPTPVKIKRILIGCTLSRLVSDEDIDAFIGKRGHGKIYSFCYRAARKLYRMAKKLFKR